jgi:hypothetical protein
MLAGANIPNHFGGYAGYDGIIRNITGYNGSSSNKRMLADADTAEYGCIAPDRGVATDSCRQANPVIRSLQRSIRVYRPRVRVVDEHDAVANEDSVLNRHARAEEAVTRDLAIGTDLHVSLNLHEWPNATAASDAAAIKVYKIRLIKNYVISERYVGRNHWRRSTFLWVSGDELKPLISSFWAKGSATLGDH